MRIYFWTGDHRRRFYWICLGIDQSVYFASSESKNFRRGFTSQTRIPIGGARVTPAIDGRTMTKDEIGGYHSLHSSGSLVLPTKSNGKRQRHQTLRLSDYPGPIPLVAVMPMELARYPIASRRAEPHDLVLDCTHLTAQPFAVMLYVKQPDAPHPPVAERHDEWDIYAQYCSLLNGIDVCAIVYANTKTFTRWQELELTVTTQPTQPNGELTWPVFAAT
jgi:hypothetical protein